MTGVAWLYTRGSERQVTLKPNAALRRAGFEQTTLCDASALSSQSLSLSEAREEIERLKGLVAGIRECPQEPVDVSAWRKAMEGVTPGDWSANGRFISAIGGVDTCEGAVYATIITCDHTYQSDGEGRHWSTTGSAERNAAWIVKCSPPAVAKLLDAYEAARSRAAEWAGSFGSKCGDHQAALRRTEDEREACAQLVENQMPASQDMTSTFICEALERAAAAIRARSVLENSKAPLADATNDPADLSSLRKGAEVEKARRAVERLANVQMNISLEEWGEISNAILSALVSGSREDGDG